VVLRLRYPAPDDWQDAKCQDYVNNTGDDPFFSDDPEVSQRAVDFCNGTKDGNICPIRHECLLFALTNNEKFGVWGGTNEITRKAIRKRYPLKGREPRPEWRHQTEQEALKGLNRDELQKELEKEQAESA